VEFKEERERERGREGERERYEENIGRCAKKGNTFPLAHTM
jgi:hypothetical protein